LIPFNNRILTIFQNGNVSGEEKELKLLCMRNFGSIIWQT